MRNSVIEHVVVLMMENHSFDHMLGYFPNIGTLGTAQQCLPNPGGSSPAQCCTYEWNEWEISPCPIHAHGNVMQQIYGFGNSNQQPPWPDPAPMNGFLADFYAGMNDSWSYPAGSSQGAGDPSELMGCFSPGSLPSLSLLATSFTVCTNWFSSVPGPTGTNRIFANCASAGGYAGAAYQYGSGEQDMPSQLASLPSVFDKLAAAGLTWQIYHEDPSFVPELVLTTVQNQASAIPADPNFVQFIKDVGAGTLANYVFLTPSLPNSQHDSWDARTGDTLMGLVYKTLIDSSLWEKTLLLITYDEHGGHYDHVPPPLSYKNDGGTNVTIENPDGKMWDAATWGDLFVGPSFDFTCLGVRVPTIIVSAYTSAGVDATIYEHASIPATLDDLWGIGTLTKRDATANSFAKNVRASVKRTADSLPRPVPAAIGKPF